jgi:hypothetical protein
MNNSPKITEWRHDSGPDTAIERVVLIVSTRHYDYYATFALVKTKEAFTTATFFLRRNRHTNNWEHAICTLE